MGVIHKLKQEVVEYILNLKRENPKVGCRKLAALASEKFQTNISKSSVNNFLKSHEMSNAVGRPKGSRKKQSFQIPQEKKKQIYESMKNLVFQEKQPPLEKKEGVDLKDQHQRAQQKPLDKFDALLKKKTQGVQKDEPSSLDEKKYLSARKQRDKTFNPTEKPAAPTPFPEEFQISEEAIVRLEPSKNFLLEEAVKKEQQRFQEEKKKRLRGPVDGIGCFFLKAAEWALVGHAFLKDLIAKYFDLHLQGPEISSMNLLCLLEKGDVASFSQRESDLPGVFLPDKEQAFRENIQEKVKNFSDKILPKELIFEYEALKDQAFLKVSSFKFFMENGKVYGSDALLRALHSSKDLPLQTNSFSHAISLLSREVLSNRDVFLSNFCMDSDEDLEDVYSLVSWCEKDPEAKVKKIELLDPQKEVVACFSCVPHMKRHFVFGLYPTQERPLVIFANEEKEIRSPYFCEFANKRIYYSETIKEFSFQGEMRLLRSIFLSLDKQKEAKSILITNNNEKKVEKIIELYLKRFPDFEAFVAQKAFLGFSWDRRKGDEKVEEQESACVLEERFGKKEPLSARAMKRDVKYFELVVDFYEEIVSYLRDEFFGQDKAAKNTSLFLSMLYKEEGCQVNLPCQLIFSLILNEGSPLIDFYQKAARELNNRLILTPQGQCLRCEIDII